MITPKQVEQFRKHYDCLIQESRSQFAIPRPTAHLAKLPDDNIATESLTMQVQSGIDVTLRPDQLQELIHDACFAIEVQRLHANHPAVVEAWDRYRILLELARNESPLSRS